MIDLTAKIDNEQAKRAYEGLKQTAKRATSSMINDFELLDATIRRFAKTLGGVGGNMAFPALYSKIKQAQSEFNKLGGVIMSPDQTDAATAQVNKLIAAINRLDEAISMIPKRASDIEVITRAMREMATQADAFTVKISHIQQSATPIPSIIPRTPEPSNTASAAGTQAYRELLVEMEAVAGSKRENIILIEQLKAKNRELKASIDSLNKAEKEGFQLSEGQIAKRGRLALEMEENNQAIKNYRREVREQIKVDQSATTSIDEMIASLDRLRTIYASLNERARQSPVGQTLQKNIEELQSRINGVGVAMQSQTEKVGYYASGFNGLSFQIQQVARELPSLAYGPQVFFGAISNNLPMLTDEITRARIQYNELVKSGQTATPVWKQMLSSIASWQTLMVAGLTVLVLYGKDIISWANSLFKGKQAIDSAKIAVEQFHSAMTKGAISAQGEITKLDLLYKAAIDTAKSYDERTRAVKKLQEEYPAYFGNMDSELIMAGNLKSAYDNLKASIIEVARARAAADKITENEGVKLSIEGTDEYDRVLSYQERINELVGKINDLKGKGISDSSPIIKGLTGTIERFEKGIERASEKITEKLKLPEEASSDVRQYISSLDEANKKLEQQAQIPYITITSSDLNKEEKDRIEAAKKAAKEAADAANKAAEDAIKLQNEIDDALLKNLLSAQKERIDAMQDGKDKELAQIDAERIAKLAAIDKEEQETAAKYAKMEQAVPQGETDTFTVRRNVVAGSVVSQTAEVEKKYAKEIEDLYTQIGSVWLTEEEKKRAEVKKTYDGMREELKALYMGGGMTGGDYLSGLWNIEQAEDQTGTKNLIDDYITYTQRREKIEKKFNDDIAAMQAKNADGSLSKNIEDAERQRKEATEALDVEIASREEVFNVWAGNIADMSIARLQEVLAKAQEELDKLEKNGGSDDKTIATARAKVSTAQKALNEANAEEGLTPGERTMKKWQDLYQTLNDIKDSFDGIGDAVGGAAGESIKTAGLMMSSTLSMINSIVTLATTSSTTMVGVSAAAATAIRTVETASVILTIIAAAMQIAMAIVNLFNNDEQHQKNIEALQSRIDELQWMLDNADIVRLQKNTVNILQQVRDVYAQTTQEVLKLHLAIEQYANGFIRSIGAGIYQNEIMAASIDKLAVAYMSVEYTADKALGGQKYKGAQDQLKNIAQQQLLIQQQINEEDAKKKTDHGQIAEWEQQIAELGAEAIKIINEMVEDIIGGSASEIADQLGSAFIEAFQTGGDAAQAWGDKVDEIVADIMKRMFIQKFLEEPLGKIFDKYKKQWFDPDKGFSLDAVIDSMGQFKDDLNNAGDTVQDIWESLPDDIKDMFNPKDAKQQATSKGFESMSQETGSELNGRFTVMSDIMARQLEIQKVMKDANLATADAMFNIRNLVSAANNHLQGIRNNTNELYEMNRRLKNIETNTAYLK